MKLFQKLFVAESVKTCYEELEQNLASLIWTNICKIQAHVEFCATR